MTNGRRSRARSVELVVRIMSDEVRTAEAAIAALCRKNGWTVKLTRRSLVGAPRIVSRNPRAVLMVKQLRDEGMTIAKIAEELNERGVPSVMGRRWWPRTVLEALRQSGDATTAGSVGTPGKRGHDV